MHVPHACKIYLVTISPPIFLYSHDGELKVRYLMTTSGPNENPF